MTDVTTAFAAQDALVAALQTLQATTLADWSVDFGLPSRRDSMHLWVDEAVTEWNQEVEVSGLTTQTEAFVLEVYVYSRVLDASAAEVRDAVKAAAAIVEGVLASDATIGGAVSFAYITGGGYEGAFADAEGRYREGVMLLRVGCRSW